MSRQTMSATVLIFALAWVSCLLSYSEPAWAQEKASKAELPQPDRQIEYKLVAGKSLKLHVFNAAQSSPEAEPKTATPKSAIVFFFGGGWSSGSPSQFYPQAKYLADRGMLAACAEYRVRSRDGALVKDCVADAQDAVAYMRTHADQLDIDPQRIVAAGGSAGGHLAAACATVSYRGNDQRASSVFRPNALVLFNPAVVLAVSAKEREQLKDERQRIEALAQRFGEEPIQLSPYHQLSAKLPPTLILHGTADTTVPYRTVEMFAKKAQELGSTCKLVGYEGQAHGFFNFQRKGAHYEPTRDEMVKFLQSEGFLR